VLSFGAKFHSLESCDKDTSISLLTNNAAVGFQ